MFQDSFNKKGRFKKWKRKLDRVTSFIGHGLRSRPTRSSQNSRSHSAKVLTHSPFHSHSKQSKLRAKHYSAFIQKHFSTDSENIDLNEVSVSQMPQVRTSRTKSRICPSTAKRHRSPGMSRPDLPLTHTETFLAQRPNTGHSVPEFARMLKNTTSQTKTDPLRQPYIYHKTQGL